MSEKEDIHEFKELHLNDAVLRLWLPEEVLEPLNQCVKHSKLTASRYLREFLVTYLYGQQRLDKMKENKTGIYFKPLSSGGGTYFQRSLAVDCIPGLGKNIVPIKLKLPKQMKSDLESIAANTGIPLGQFVREILVSHLLGHTFWSERHNLFLEKMQDKANEWVDQQLHEESIENPDDDINRIWNLA